MRGGRRAQAGKAGLRPKYSRLLSLLSTMAVAAASASAVFSNLENALSFTICGEEGEGARRRGSRVLAAAGVRAPTEQHCSTACLGPSTRCWHSTHTHLLRVLQRLEVRGRILRLLDLVAQHLEQRKPRSGLKQEQHCCLRAWLIKLS